MNEDFRILHLHLKKEWYNMILSGEKKEEYRECTDYWRKRFANKYFTHILFYYGYTNRRMLVPVRYLICGVGKIEWGAPSHRNVFIFGLDKVIGEFY